MHGYFVLNMSEWKNEIHFLWLNGANPFWIKTVWHPCMAFFCAKFSIIFSNHSVMVYSIDMKLLPLSVDIILIKMLSGFMRYVGKKKRPPKVALSCLTPIQRVTLSIQKHVVW